MGFFKGVGRGLDKLILQTVQADTFHDAVGGAGLEWVY